MAASFVAFASARAEAGSIGFRTDAEVTAGPGVDAKITLTHTGDEAAADVSVSAELLGRTTDGEKIASIAPGQSQVWNFHLTDHIAPGVYAIALRARYSDANGYPFEVVSIANAPVGVKAAARVFGNIEVPRLPVGGEVTAHLTAKRPPGRSGTMDAEIVAPGGIDVQPERVTLSFDESGKARADFRIRNQRLLAGTSVNVFAFVTGIDAGFPQTDTIRGTVSISAASVQLSAPMFYEAAAAVMALLLVLEATAWARGGHA
jgi:hypothetical protein